jgi:ribosomal protein S18 acetylase RimI-like enzyme
VRVLQDVLARAPGYFVLERGAPAAHDEARRMLDERPPGRTHADKEVLLAFDDGEAIGCVDIAFAWPDATTAVIGLLLVAEDRQRRGLGRALYALVEARLRARFARLRIGVLARNTGALGFWRALGFIATGERKPHAHGAVRDEVVVLEKPLA